MKSVNALQLRQSMGAVVDELLRTGEPVLLEKGRKPVAVLISLKDFRERFSEKAAAEDRERIFDEIAEMAITPSGKASVDKILRNLRYGD